MPNRAFRAPRHRRALVAASALALGVALAPSASAQAAAGAGAGAARPLLATGTAAPHAFSFVTRDAKTGAPMDVSCTPNLQNPFRYSGGLYGQGVEALASLSCTQPVYEISTACALDDYTSQVAYNSHTVYSTLSGACDAEAPINPGQVGQYTTLAQYTVIVTFGGSSVTSPVYQTTPAVTLHY